MSKKLYSLSKKDPIDLHKKKPVFNIKKDIPKGKTVYFRIMGLEVTNNNGVGEAMIVFEKSEDEKHCRTAISLPFKNIPMGEPSRIIKPGQLRKR